MSDLGNSERQVLAVLDEWGGTTSKDVARAVRLAPTLISGSQLARGILSSLCDRGLARLMDNQTPLCWVRTPAGTAALVEAGEDADAD